MNGASIHSTMLQKRLQERSGSPQRDPQTTCWRAVLLLFLFQTLIVTSGCSTSGKPETSITIEGVSYSTCFDQALLVARGSGMPPVLRNRAGGVVETAPRISGSIFEPWRMDNEGFGEAVENTLNMQRRRARFEFAPSGFNPAPVQDSTVLTGPALPGSQVEVDQDLRFYEGPIELRVWVYVERSFKPGLQNATWTRSMTSYSTDRISRRDSNDVVSDPSTWTPVRRDTDYEVRLINAFKKRIEQLESS